MKWLGRILLGLVALAGLFWIWTALQPDPPRPDLDLAPAPQATDLTVPTPNFMPRNPYLADSVNPLPHGDPGQQDASSIPGPSGPTRVLSEPNLRYRFLGPGHFGAYLSSPYPDGHRVLWTSGVNGVFKLDNETYDIIDSLPSEHADTYTEAWAEEITAKLERNNGASAIPTAIKALKPLTSLSGIYAVVGSNGWFYQAYKDGSVVAFGDAVEGVRSSPIVEKARFQLPPDLAGPSVGMNMTYDGWIVFAMEDGRLVAVNRDLTDYRAVDLPSLEGEDRSQHGTGYGWVRNAVALDEDGGLYVASRNHMHKVIWTGDDFSLDRSDGAWTARYRNGFENSGDGTGATPSLMGFGDEDRFVVITDGDPRMNVVLFWRDDIPDDWEQLPDTPDRRIAGQAPVTMGDLDVQRIQSEQTVIVAGYGAVVVNNTPRNTPFFMPKEGVARGVAIGPLGGHPDFQPYGVQKFVWNPDARRLEAAWVNETISSPNGVPWASVPLDAPSRLYFIGARDNQWTLEAVDWATGAPDFHYVLGGQKYNSEFSGPFIDERGRMTVGTMWGRLRIEP